MQELKLCELRQAVEHKVGRKMLTPRDFDFLSTELSIATGRYISTSTLKRLWGYVEVAPGYQPNIFTLNTLALFVGHKGFSSFNSGKDQTTPSKFINKTHLLSSQLQPGDILILTWQPDRLVKIKFLGQDMFSVISSENSKLSAGDTFCCGNFICGYPLYLTHLLHGNMPATSYVCGQETGISYTILPYANQVKPTQPTPVRGGVAIL